MLYIATPLLVLLAYLLGIYREMRHYDRKVVDGHPMEIDGRIYVAREWRGEAEDE